jgi:hypothetical protein
MAGFDRPDAPGRDPDAPQFDPNMHIGDLLVLQVTDLMESVETEYGDRPVVVADVFVIDRDATIKAEYPEAWLFGTVLYSQLKKKRGRTVLGVLEQGEKRPGKKPPWRLADPSDAQEAAALRAMASKPDAPQEDEPAAKPADDPWWPSAPATVGADSKAPWE